MTTSKLLSFRNLIRTMGDFVYLDTDSAKLQDRMFNYYNTYHKVNIILYPVDSSIYQETVQDFLEIVEDARTHVIEVHYIGSKLYYSYMI